MPMYLHSLLGVLLVAGRATAHVVFGDIEELKPRPLKEFCDKDVTEGLRHCEGSVAHMMEDGGIVRMNWAMHADPDRILSIDVEKEHGVKILKCTPSTMELELPESHAWHAKVGQLIVASAQSHTCEHYPLIDEINKEENGPEDPTVHDLYHRVTKVLSIDWLNADGSLAAGSSKGKKARVKLWTKELEHIGKAIPTVSYNFDYIPVTVPKEHEPARKQLEKEQMEKAKARKLQTTFPTMDASDFSRPGQGDDSDTSAVNWDADSGQPLFSGRSIVTDDVKSLMNFRPKQVANFAWDWNFGANASVDGSQRDMWYNYTLHGGQLDLLIKKPYLLSHNTISLQFRSYTPHQNAQDAGFTNDHTWVEKKVHSSQQVAKVFTDWEPRVKWVFKPTGHGEIRGNLLAQMHSRLDNIDTAPLKSFPIPVLKRFWKPKCFGVFHFAIGNFPISLSPCVEFQAKFFHYGRFHGSFGIGLATKAEYKPVISFDSFTGLRVELDAKLTDVSLTPPMWILKTRHFECGIALEPSISLKGQLGTNVRQTRGIIAIRPYVNMTITRDLYHQPNYDGAYTSKELIIYPFRITGNLGAGLYKVKIETVAAAENFNHEDIVSRGWVRTKTTSATPFWGEVEFQDPVRSFSFGLVPQQDLLKMHIKVSIIRVAADATETVIGQPAIVTCHSETNGVCQPSPMLAKFAGTGGQVVTVYLHGIWNDNPQTFFTSKYKGVSVHVDELIINKQYLEKNVNGFKITDWKVGVGEVKGAEVDKPIIVVITHGAKSYPLNMNRHRGYVPSWNTSSVTGDTVFELGASFLSTWDTACATSGAGACDPRVSVYLGNQLIATARVPPISWAGESKKLQDNLHMAAAIVGHHPVGGHDVPVSVSLSAASGAVGVLAPSAAANPNIGMVRLNFRVAGPTAWNRFIAPRVFDSVVSGEQMNFTWSLSEEENKAIPFRIKFLRKSAADTFSDPKLFVDAKGSPEFVPQIGDWPFEEVIELRQDITIAPHDSGMEYQSAISRSRYVLKTAIGTQFPAGGYMMIMVEWTDMDGKKHSMPSPPVRVVTAAQKQATLAAEAKKAAAAAAAAANKSAAAVVQNGPTFNDIISPSAQTDRRLSEGSEERRLFWPFDGPHMSTPAPLSDTPNFDDMWDNSGGQFAECKKKDLHFKYGAGVSFKAYVKHLTLPEDLPVLGGINNAPEIGTPWIYGPTYTTSPEDLKAHLPRLFCRHGLCEAALPGCAETADRRSFFPQISLHFQHTFRYDTIKSDQLANSLRTGLAYVFAVAPEAIHLLLHYTNNSVEKMPLPPNPDGTPGTTLPPNSGRRRTSQHNTELSGEVVCENPGITTRALCASKACCVWGMNRKVCESGVGTGPCTGGFRGDVYESTPAPVASAAAPVAAAAAFKAVPQMVPATVLPPTVPPVPANGGVNIVIPPLGSRRRLEEHDDDLHEEELRGDRRPIHQMTISFKGGLEYELTRPVMDELIQQGVFREVLSKSDRLDEKFEIHSYTIHDLSPSQAKATYGTVTLFAVLGSVVLGVAATLARRGSVKLYQRVEESAPQDDQVELE